MGMLDRSGSSTRAFARHTDLVHSVAEGAAPPPDIAPVSLSWRRSAGGYGVDPVDRRAPTILTAGEIKDFRAPLDRLLISAREEIDRLYQVVREAGYTILFCDTAGVAVEHRGDAADANRCEYWGTWLGGVWSEAIEGTNGIGTCIAEERPITVHRGQHFRSRHMDLSCSGAPIFGVDGRLTAVLDVSAIDPGRSEGAHALTGALTTNAARAMEERFFREQFPHAWIVAIAPAEHGGAGMLLAVDRDQRVIGANRGARGTLSLDDSGLRDGIGIWSLFEPNGGLFHGRPTGDVAARLLLRDSNDSRMTLVTPPSRMLAAWRDPAAFALHARPRLDLGGAAGAMPPAPVRHGGLAPGVVRRVRDYMDAHLGDSIDLATLAGVAGLSVHHFAREFKRSTGDTPHDHLIRRRVERARDMLATTGDSLAEIAFAVGFADQGHLARHFRRMLGVTPGQYRRSRRQ